MVLTNKQKEQLNKALYEYLNNNYPESGKIFKAQAKLKQEQYKGNSIQKKWDIIYIQQNKIIKLEKQNQQLKKQIQSGDFRRKKKQHLEYILKIPEKTTLKGHKGNITAIAIHPQITQFATSSQDGTIIIWDFDSSTFVKKLKGHTGTVSQSGAVNSIVYHPQGKYLISCSSDLTIKIWEVQEGQCYKTLYGHEHNISTVKMIPNGDRIISASRDKTIKLWEFSTGYCKKTFTGHNQWVRMAICNSTGKFIASCSSDQMINLWNIDKQSPLCIYRGHQHVIQCIAFIQGQAIKQINSGQLVTKKKKMKVQDLKIFLQDNNQNQKEKIKKQASNQQFFILSASRDKTIKLWSSINQECIHTFIGHDNWVRALQVHPTGKCFYSVSDDKTIRIWDLKNGKQIKIIEGHDHFITSVVANYNYGILITGSVDMTIKIWQFN